jgi:hypothetical protein
MKFALMVLVQTKKAKMMMGTMKKHQIFWAMIWRMWMWKGRTICSLTQICGM